MSKQYIPNNVAAANDTLENWQSPANLLVHASDIKVALNSLIFSMSVTENEFR